METPSIDLSEDQKKFRLEVLGIVSDFFLLHPELDLNINEILELVLAQVFFEEWSFEGDFRVALLKRKVTGILVGLTSNGCSAPSFPHYDHLEHPNYYTFLNRFILWFREQVFVLIDRASYRIR